MMTSLRTLIGCLVAVACYSFSTHAGEIGLNMVTDSEVSQQWLYTSGNLETRSFVFKQYFSTTTVDEQIERTYDYKYPVSNPSPANRRVDLVHLGLRKWYDTKPNPDVLILSESSSWNTTFIGGLPTNGATAYVNVLGQVVSVTNDSTHGLLPNASAIENGDFSVAGYVKFRIHYAYRNDLALLGSTICCSTSVDLLESESPCSSSSMFKVKFRGLYKTPLELNPGSGDGRYFFPATMYPQDPQTLVYGDPFEIEKASGTPMSPGGSWRLRIEFVHFEAD